MATGFSAANSLTVGVRAFEQNRAALADIAARLTSGKRILSIGDDSASVTIAAGLRAQFINQRSAVQNTAQASGVVDTAQQGLDRIGEALTQLRAIAVQASDASLLEPERALLAVQFESVRSELDTVASGTRFNGTTLLDGSFNVTVDLGTGDDGAVTIALDDSSSTALFGGAIPSLATAGDAANAVDAVDDATARFDVINGTASGAAQQLSQAAEALTRSQGGVSSATSVLVDADSQAELARQTATQLRQNTTSNVIAQTQQLTSDLLALISTPIAPLPAIVNTTEEAGSTDAGTESTASDASSSSSSSNESSTASSSAAGDDS